MIIDLNGQEWAHLEAALSKHRVWCREYGIPVPKNILSVLEIASRRGGDNRESVGDLLECAVLQSKVAITYSETADRLGVSKRTVERLIGRGELRSVSIAGAPRIRLTDLDSYMDGISA